MTTSRPWWAVACGGVAALWLVALAAPVVIAAVRDEWARTGGTAVPLHTIGRQALANALPSVLTAALALTIALVVLRLALAGERVDEPDPGAADDHDGR
ncbi:hypothetical protein [Rathayibacter sp. VKM Ac-2754]|uniref:hypothetical protein n=1 Tax=Rathayibacter sp. VKM Ac-2754 TaxID=2609251 RepID=UPI00135C5FF9|nr:hypothetical protein [Rathayibacter sp. VKM Ac-2754]MWV59130.1 hypothetical protein [Rathayibacter sp. VKM Ac-2754]